MTKVADDTKLFRMLEPEPDFRDVQKYFMVLNDKVISKKSDRLIRNKKG